MDGRMAKKRETTNYTRYGRYCTLNMREGTKDNNKAASEAFSVDASGGHRIMYVSLFAQSQPLFKPKITIFS